MFDIGFAELLIIGVVGLLVIGPERLPEAIRTGSAWLNRFRRSFNEIRDEVRRELHNDSVLRDLRKTSDDLREKGSDLKRQLEASVMEEDTDAARPVPKGGAPAVAPGVDSRESADGPEPGQVPEPARQQTDGGGAADEGSR